jgi:hypothetical protein
MRNRNVELPEQMIPYSSVSTVSVYKLSGWGAIRNVSLHHGIQKDSGANPVFYLAASSVSLLSDKACA